MELKLQMRRFVMFSITFQCVDLIGFRHNKNTDVKETQRFNPNPTLNEELAVYAEQDIDHVNDALNAKEEETKDTKGKADTKANKPKRDYHTDIKYKYTGEIFSREKKSLPVSPPHKGIDTAKVNKDVKGDDASTKYSHFCLQGLPGNVALL